MRQIPETLARTTLGFKQPGDLVNLERAVSMSTRLSGHLVQGHVDGTACIASRQAEKEWDMIWFDCPVELSADMIKKGSITRGFASS